MQISAVLIGEIVTNKKASEYLRMFPFNTHSLYWNDLLFTLVGESALNVKPLPISVAQSACH